jgi:hypothetical protein
MVIKKQKIKNLFFVFLQDPLIFKKKIHQPILTTKVLRKIHKYLKNEKRIF